MKLSSYLDKAVRVLSDSRQRVQRCFLVDSTALELVELTGIIGTLISPTMSTQNARSILFTHTHPQQGFRLLELTPELEELLTSKDAPV